jgi:PAS domain S-box-containing protein
MMQQYAIVACGVVVTLGLCLVVRGYAYPRPLFLVALLVTAWGRGLGPTLTGAALAIAASEYAFPWLPRYGLVADIVVFGLAGIICSRFSAAKVRTEAELRTLCAELEASQAALVRIEENRRESEVRFRTLADCAPVLVWMSGPDAACTYFNKSWLDFRGRSLESELGNGWSEGVHPDDLRLRLETYRVAFSARRPFTMEYRLLRADGEYRWLLDNGIPLHTGSEFVGFIGTCVDVTDLKLADEQRILGERRLLDTQRLAHVGTWERYLEADTMCWSDEALRILGRQVDPPANFAAFLTLVHPDHREKIRTAHDQAVSTRAPAVVEYRIRRPDGEERHVRSIVEVIIDNQGRARALGATQDVTEHVGALNQLRKSEERLRTAQRLSHVGNWDWDLRTNKVFWSDETYRIFGRSPELTPGYETFLDAVLPQDRDRVEAKLKDVIAGGKPSPIEFQIVRPDGDLRTLTCVPEVFQDSAGAAVRMSGACQDVTDQKRAEKERARLAKLADKEHERLNAIISSIPGLVWESRGFLGDSSNRVVFVSEQVESMLGWRVEEWMSTPGFCASIVHPEDRERFVREASAIFNSQRGSGFQQFRFLTRAGATVWVESHIAVVHDEKGNRVGMRGVTMDITDRKEAETALMRTREQLARVTRVISMGEVAASIAHEINQPLAAIVTNGEACLRWLSNPSNSDRAIAIVGSIINDANRAGDVIRGIRGLLTNGESRREPIDFNQVIQETLALLHEHALSHNVQMKASLASQLPPVLGDRIQLQQVVLNLLINGIDATDKDPANGARELVVSTGIDAPEGILLEVRDHGPGVRSGDGDRIFRPFFTTKKAGLGMGLSISRTIIESHGGRIGVTANQPRGAIFWVHLPTR